jgi:hypothetical protein
MGLVHGLLDEGGSEGGVLPNKVGNIDNLKIRSRCEEGGSGGHGECERLHDGATNQVNFSLTGDTVSEEGEASIGSVARINPKVALAKGAICQTNNHREFRARGVQPDKDLTLGRTGCH